MTDFAKLVVAVDATGMSPGDQALDRLAAKGAQAEAQVTKATGNMSKGMAQVGGSAKSMGPAVQNAAFQVGDFAVQVASGTDATRAFAQQMPQLLGGLGMFGAVAGAAVAVGAALLPMLLDGQKGAKALDDALDDVNASLRSYKEIVDMTQAPARELYAQFGEGALKARELFDIMAMIERLKFANALSGVKESIAEIFDGLDGRLARIDQVMSMGAGQNAAVIARQARIIQEEFGLTEAQARGVAKALDDIAAANGPREAALAAADLARQLVEAQEAGAKLPPEIIAAASEIANFAASALEAANILGDTETTAGEVAVAVGNIAGNMGVAADEAARFAANVLAGISAQNRADAIGQGGGRGDGYTEMRLRGLVHGGGQRFDDYLGTLSPEARGELSRMTGQVLNPPAPRKGSKGGGRGNRDADRYDRSVIEIQQQTEAFLAQADALSKVATAGGDWERALAVIEEEQKLLNAAQRAGIELTPEVKAQINEMAQAYVDAETALERIRTSTERGQDAFRDLFGSILEGAGSAKQALANLLMQMAKVQFAKGMLGLLGGTSWGSTLIKSVGDSLTFDGGGYTGDGSRSGGLDGKGGFMAMLHPQETVIDHTKGQSAGGSVVKVIAQHDPGILMRVIDSRVDAAKPGFVSQAVSAARYDASENPWP